MERKKVMSECPYRERCHFYGMSEMSPHSENLKIRFCMEWPGLCEIYKAKVQGRNTTITLWPTGYLV
jgi:hypothetical protein